MKALGLAAAAVMLFSSTALAGVTCEPPVYDTDATILVCGDPRVFVSAINDSNYAVPFKVVYWRGNKAVGGKVVKRFTVPAETTRALGPIWALGGKPFIVKSLAPGQNGQNDAPYWETLEKVTVSRGLPWGTGGCPAALPKRTTLY